MVPCPKCKKDIQEIGATGQGICPNCGIVELVKAPIESQPFQKRFCQYCGRELPSGVSYCSNCGRQVKSEGAPLRPSTAIEKTSKPSKAWYLVPIFLTLIGSIIGYFALKDRDKKMARNIVIVGIVMAFVWISIIAAIPSPETTTTPQPQIITTSEPQKTTAALAEIKDLAYVKIFAGGYTDDADPEEDGLSIDISYYDSNSELINFRNTPVLAHIQVFGYRDILDTFDHEKMEVVYETSITIDHSMALKEMFGRYIRISFEDMAVNKDRYYIYGTVKVIVETSQGKFEGIHDLASLYAEK